MAKSPMYARSFDVGQEIARIGLNDHGEVFESWAGPLQGNQDVGTAMPKNDVLRRGSNSLVIVLEREIQPSFGCVQHRPLPQGEGVIRLLGNCCAIGCYCVLVLALQIDKKRACRGYIGVVRCKRLRDA